MRSNPTNAAIEQNRTLMATLPVGKLDQVSRQREYTTFCPLRVYRFVARSHCPTGENGGKGRDYDPRRNTASMAGR